MADEEVREIVPQCIRTGTCCSASPSCEEVGVIPPANENEPSVKETIPNMHTILVTKAGLALYVSLSNSERRNGESIAKRTDSWRAIRVS